MPIVCNVAAKIVILFVFSAPEEVVALTHSNFFFQGVKAPWPVDDANSVQGFFRYLWDVQFKKKKKCFGGDHFSLATPASKGDHDVAEWQAA